MHGTALPTVLIVDDSEGVCLALSMMLVKQGFQVTTARSYQEGLHDARARKFSLILVDAYLGTESGLTLAEEILSQDPRCGLVIMSGSVLLQEEMKSRPLLKKVAILQKPFTRQELMECIRKAVDKAA